MSQADVLRSARPRELFDREAEWDALMAFACDPRPGATLGLVSGQRRLGKTYLLEALTRATGGFYFGAQEAAEAESMLRLGEQLARHTGASRPPSGWRRWDDAIDALLALGDRRPIPVVIDGFPELVHQSPSLPAVIGAAFRRLHGGQQHSRARLLLCGSDMPVMKRLLSGPSPLRGLADLELVVRPLDFRQAARFWNTDDPRLALLVHAVVGGSPAYRHDCARDDVPTGADDFDDWVCRTVLSPRVPLSQEARHLLEEEPGHLDRALGHSALAAIAAGCSTPGEIAEWLDRPMTDVPRTLAHLRDSGLVRAEPDAFRPGVTRYRIAEPLLAFDHAIARPNRSALEQEGAVEVWRRVRPVFDAVVAGTHFAQVCRAWVAKFSAPTTFGASFSVVSHGSLPGAAPHGSLDAEVVVRGPSGGRPGVLLSVGQARWNEAMDIHHLERLHYLVSLLAAGGEDTGRVRPACYSGIGFSPELHAAQARGEVVLVGLDRLYHGE